MVAEWTTAEVIQTVLASGGGGAAVAYGLFKYFGSTWLENKFAERLQTHKHEQDKEIQKLRIEIDSLLSGTLKLQERDFQILPEAWQRIHEAYGLTTWLTSPLQQYPDIERLSSPELEEFFKSSWLKDTQKDTLRTTKDKNNKYQEFHFWHFLSKAEQAVRELKQYVSRNGIFFPEQIRGSVDKMVEHLFRATALKESEHEHHKSQEKFDHKELYNLRNDIEALHKSLQHEIASHLRSHGTAHQNQLK